MMDPGFRLRQIRERLGLTYRDVQRATLSLSRLRARPNFTIHISRLADIENAGESLPTGRFEYRSGKCEAVDVWENQRVFDKRWCSL